MQRTGHGASPLGSLEGTLLLRTERMRGVELDPSDHLARIEAGALWRDVVEVAAPHGLVGLSGSSPDVGAVGYLLSGGLSFLGRKYGVAAHSIVAAELVTADGRLVRADEEQNEELLWALRGGGGNFGVVTALEIRLFAVTELYAGVLWFPFDSAAEVLGTWADLTRGDLPDELTTVGRLLQLPPLPEIPEPVRGKSFAVVEVIHIGDPALADELIGPLRALGPVMDTIAPIPTTELGKLHMDPEHPVPVTGDGFAFDTLPEAAVDALVAAAGPKSDSSLLSVEVRHLGGALGRPRPDHAALASADGSHILYAVGVAATPELESANQTKIGGLREALRPWTAERVAPNFAETRRDPVSLWGQEAHTRLCRVKERVDPDDLFRSNHPLLADASSA